MAEHDHTPAPEELPARPSDRQVQTLATAIEPLRKIVDPKVYGAENIPKTGALLVGNHTLFAFMDLPFMMSELWRREQLIVRGLGDHAHYAIPGWRDLLTMCGMVRGTRANTAELMRRGEHVLVFPGGNREVNKRKGEKYQLIWEQRTGFAKIAIQHGYPIVPFAAVGAEEMLDVLVDDNNPIYAKFTEIVKKTTGWPMQPLVRGIGPTVIPRPERLYFSFGKPIPTAEYTDDLNLTGAARYVRDHAKRDVEHQIDVLLAERERDPRRRLTSRIRRAATS
jgi:1-acyl-sn-glycerol-3-phosphate acyltransferase